MFSFRIARTKPDQAASGHADLHTQQLAEIRDIIMAVSVQVQKALDDIRNTNSLLASYMQATKLQSTQIDTLSAKVTDLQSKLDAGQPINAEDLAAIAEITSDIDQVNAQLASAVPANTPSGGGVPNAPTSSPAPVGSPAVAAAGSPAPQETVTTPPPAPDTTQTANAQAASQATPLPGTGA